MSRQEIDRILQTDLGQLDQNVSKKISSIEEMTGTVSKRAKFLIQFQKMMQQEMDSMKKNNVHEATPLYRTENVQMPTIVQEYKQPLVSCDVTLSPQPLNASDVSHIDYSQLQAVSNVKDTSLNEQLEPVRFELTVSHARKPLTIDRTLLLRKLSICKQKLHSLKVQLPELKNGIKDKVQKQQKILQNKLIQFVNLQKKQKEKQTAQMLQLRQQITWLKQELNQINNRINNRNCNTISLGSSIQGSPIPQRRRHQPLKQITFKEINQQKMNQFFTKTIKFKPCELNFDQPSPIAVSPNHSINLHLLQPSRLCLNTQNTQQNNISFCRQVPLIKSLSIGVPPVRDGFGVLKRGKDVIYRGMWAGGKFQGRGKLVWDDYSYQGDFKQGKFDGYGKLSWSVYEYIGKFRAQSAQGQGTLTSPQNKLYGEWHNGKLFRAL